VINIGTATLAALIGAGGLGEPILSGLNLNDNATILEGAVPAALLALLVQGLLICLIASSSPEGCDCSPGLAAATFLFSGAAGAPRRGATKLARRFRARGLLELRFPRRGATADEWPCAFNRRSATRDFWPGHIRH
jgi:hypothetical protein